MHYRKLIRDKVKEILEEIPALSGRCYINPVSIPSPEDLPAVCIYTPHSETVRRTDQWTEKKKCTVEIRVHAVAADAAEAADDVDAVCLLIESELLKDQTLGGLCEAIESRSDDMETVPGDEDVTGSCKMIYEALFVFSNEIETDDFQVLNVDWKLAPGEETSASDELALPD